MKKLRLRALSLGAKEILSREQLRSITGGCSQDVDCGPGYCANGTCQGGSDQGGAPPGGSGSGENPNDSCASQGLCSSYNSAGGAFCCCITCDDQATLHPPHP